MGFLSYSTMMAYAKFLTQHCLQASRDFTLFDMVRGPLIPCPWIDWKRYGWFSDRAKDKFTMAWLRDGNENLDVKDEPVMAVPE